MNGINFLVDTPNAVVLYNSSCPLSISCNELGRIQPTDTIRVDSFTTAEDVNCPSFLARVADIQYKCLLPDDINEHVHPAVGNPRLLQPSSLLIKVVLHIIVADDMHDRYHGYAPPSPEEERATINVPEVAQTNLSVWIEPDQIVQLIDIHHTHHAKYQYHGPISGRMSTYYTRFTCTINNNYDNDAMDDEDHYHYQFQIIMPHEQYSSLFLESDPPTSSQTTIAAKSLVCKTSIKVMNKAGKMGGVVSLSMSMPISYYNSIVQSINYRHQQMREDDEGEHITVKESIVKTKQNITNSNLSLGAILIPTNKGTIKATSSAGFAILRDVFGSSFGVGVRGKYPPISQIDIPAQNPRNISVYDTINMVDVSVGDDPPLGWFDPQADGVGTYGDDRNFIRMVYNKRNNECRLSIKCCAILSGNCEAPAFIEYMNSIRTTWSNHGDAADDLYLNAAIEVTGEVWYVTAINHNNDVNDVVTTTHAINGQIQGRSVQFCVDNIM